MTDRANWKAGSGEKKIEMFIGTWGVSTGTIENTNELLDKASQIFEIENTWDAATMATAIEALGRKGRKAAAGRNMERVMGPATDPRAASKSVGEVTEASLERMMANSKPHMIDGAPFDCEGQLDIDPAQLLRKVVSAVISSGHADILWEFPEVGAFFKARIPQRHEVEGLHNVDERMFDAAEKWPNRRLPDPQ